MAKLGECCERVSQNKETTEREREEAKIQEERNQAEKQKDELLKLAANEDRGRERQSQPLTPLMPREESPIGSPAEEVEGTAEDLEKVGGKESPEGQLPISMPRHKNTRPAEPTMPKKRRLTGGETQLRLEQTVYLTIWMQKDEAQRRVWEREQHDEEEDVSCLAKEIQCPDEHLGEGATMQCVRSQLQEWGVQGMEEARPQKQTPETPWQRQN